jgi:hypothetical protein
MSSIAHGSIEKLNKAQRLVVSRWFFRKLPAIKKAPDSEGWGKKR